ncbi:MAG: RNA-binding transcriptional accessory protein, partial [Clostridiales bacterium]|nr:RNA-binding transcriptional accessory protein [Clostridiales bacterium]
MSQIISQLIKEFNLKPFQVENTVKLIDDGNTIPFIARYRKEMTGELNDQVLRELGERLVYLRNLETRRDEVRKTIEEQGKLTDEVATALKKAVTLTEVEDIYRPYKQKRRTRATIARERGLEPLASILYLQQPIKGTIEDISKPFIDPEKGVNSSEDALNSAMDILAEDISDNAEYRKAIREIYFKQGILIVKSKKDEDSVYRMYYDFMEPVSKIANHRVLAINRGEAEEFLKVKIEVPSDLILNYLKGKMLRRPAALTTEFVERAVEDSFSRLISSSVENEV